MAVQPPTKRRKGDDARAAIIRAGVEIVTSRGPIADPLGVELTEAISRADVPRSTGYRLFADDDLTAQEAFARDLAVDMFTQDPFSNMENMEAVALEVFAQFDADLFEAGTGEQLATALRELIRRATDASMVDLRSNPVFWSYMSAYGTTGRHEGEPAPGSVAKALADGEEATEFIEWYQAMAHQFGLRLKPGWTWFQFNGTASTAVLGTALRSGLNPYVNGVMRPTGPDGELQSWSAGGVLFEGLVLTALEPNPRVVNAANLTTWLP